MIGKICLIFIFAYIVWGTLSCILSYRAWKWFNKKADLEAPNESSKPTRKKFYPIVIGIIERVIYMTFIGFEINGAGAFIGTWVFAKATGGWLEWQKQSKEDCHTYGKVLFFNALILNGISIILGIIGGFIIKFFWENNFSVIERNIKIIFGFSYIFIIIGSIGMIMFLKKFPLPTRPERMLGLNGSQVWFWSWLFIIIGALMQLIWYILP